MRPFGFSTGALAPGDAARALAMLVGKGTRAVELSALRMAELRPLAREIATLDLAAFAYVSFHAPSRFEARDEAEVVDVLGAFLPAAWPIVVHPDAIHDFAAWRGLGARVAIENMDRRKPIGRTVGELARIFEALPEARFCFDVGHARQVDRTMVEADFLARELGPRLAELHVSEVSTRSRHDPLSRASVAAFRRIARWVPEGVPILLETPANEGSIAGQLQLAEEALLA